MSDQTPKPKRGRRPRNTKAKVHPPAKAPQPKAMGSEMEWQILFNEVVTHPKFNLSCKVFKTKPEEFKVSKPSFNTLRGLRDWCNRRLREDLINELKSMQARGEMDCYLRKRGFRHPRQVIFDLWSDRDLVTAYRVVANQQVNGDPYLALRAMGLSADPVGYRGKTRSHASAKKSKPRNPEDKATNVRRNGDKPYVTIGNPNPQGTGPSQRGAVVGGAGKKSTDRAKGAKKHPGRRGGGRR